MLHMRACTVWSALRNAQVLCRHSKAKLAACEQVDCKTAASWLMSIASANFRQEKNPNTSAAALQAQEALVVLLRSQRTVAELLITEQCFALPAEQQAEQPHNKKITLDAQTIDRSSALLKSSADR